MGEVPGRKMRKKELESARRLRPGERWPWRAKHGKGEIVS
jgi:hypothetical protein